MSYMANDLSDDELFEIIVAFTLAQEGGYVKDDPNGPTKFGISQKFLDAHNLITLSPNKQIKELTVDDAKNLYKNYFYKSYIRDIARNYSLKVAIRFFDIIVNMGEFNASVLFQKTINYFTIDKLYIDGKIGTDTLHKLRLININMFYSEFIRYIYDYYKNLGKKDKYKKYLQGWLNRLYTPIEDFLHGYEDSEPFMRCPNCGLYLFN